MPRPYKRLITMKTTKGYTHLYTGNGKGKTTASLGLALRALGAGFTVAIIQFMKSGESSEFHALKRFGEQVRTAHFGRKGFIFGEPSEEDRALGKKALEAARHPLNDKNYDMVILDEAAVAASYGIVAIDDLLNIIKNKPPQCELVITGRNADPRLIEAADLVTEMREVKHYYARGVEARKGIEE